MALVPPTPTADRDQQSQHGSGTPLPSGAVPWGRALEYYDHRHDSIAYPPSLISEHDTPLSARIKERLSDWRDGFRRHSSYASGESGSDGSLLAENWYNLPDPLKAAFNTANAPLSKKLGSRHLQVIVLGCCIGSGLFSGSGTALATGGPGSVMLCYTFVAVLMWCTMQALTELAVVYPIAGSFAAYSIRFIDPAWGFAQNYTYALSWAITLPLELVVAVTVLDYWNMDAVAPRAVWVTVFFVTIVSFNLFGIRVYAEIENIFTTIKVFAIIGFIILGITIDVAGGPEGSYLGAKTWTKPPGPFLNGITGVVSVFVNAAFSFGGFELLGLAAAETRNPRRSIPTATKKTYASLTSFYLISLLIVTFLVPFDDPRLLAEGKSTSPFVIAIKSAGIMYLPDIFNGVVLLSVLSVANTCVYASSRVIAAIAEQGQGPSALRFIDREGRPMRATLLTLLFGFIAYVSALGYETEGEVFNWLLSICGLGSFFTWGSICLCHIRFRAAWKAQGNSLDQLAYRSQGGIIGSYLGLSLNIVVFLAVLWTALFTTESWKPDIKNFMMKYLTVPMLLVEYFAYKLFFKTKILKIHEVDLVTGCIGLLDESWIEERREREADWPKWKKIATVMADLNDEFKEILDDDGSLDPLIDFNFGAMDQPEIGDDCETDFFEQWNAGLSQFSMNPAILLPGVSGSQVGYDGEPDAPHDIDCEAGFLPSSMLFAQDPTSLFLPAGPGYQFYEQGQIYSEPFLGQDSPSPNPMSIERNLAIDPQLDNSGSSEYDNFQDLVGTAEAGTFILPGVGGEYGLIGMSSVAPIAPMNQLTPEADLALPLSTIGPNANGKRALKPNNNNGIDDFNSEGMMSKAKGKAPITGGRSKYRPMNRAPLAETSGNSAGSDLDDGIDLENIAGSGKRSLSMPQTFAQSVGFRQEYGLQPCIEDNNFDSDETIDLEEYAAACNAIDPSVQYLSRADFTPEFERELSAETPPGIASGESSFLQPTGGESVDGTSLTHSIPIKRGRGRPIVPGSKRQRRIQAMAQPDYVPPKRGRPRTNEHGQRKRVRRTKTTQPVLQPIFSPIPPYIPQPKIEQFMPKTHNQDTVDFSFNQVYKPIVLNNEVGYTPDQFILDPIQAGKIQQIYNVELPVGGWAETAERWRLTFNLNRITPTSESLFHELSEMVKTAPITARHDTGRKENIDPDSEDAANRKTVIGLTTDIQPLTQIPDSEKKVDFIKKTIFPDQRLQVIAGDGTYHEMTHEQVLEKLLDERDIYFRTIVWELLQKSQRIASMNFVGSLNRMSGVWEFT
ncbi:glyceraldehyde-3-phosphate dehydrogenase 1 [Orbilia oligospora]|uniref:Glyceraldehyde-3-phosphate dehydrogenase 1 n=1 Tax=Orbilia oligospora TaxID=2813651 RepID=A0A7C8RF65_ORBOL|nr:glyceraldehyde-3-phosphate dehydrogenase 1 [Orbilia oligospora]